MKLNEYIKNLKAIEKKHGGDLIVVFSNDDEGNWFDEVNFTPSIGNYNQNEFHMDDYEEEELGINAVCIN